MLFVLLLLACCGLAFLVTGSSSDDEDESDDEVAALLGNLLVGTFFGMASLPLATALGAFSTLATGSWDDLGVATLAGGAFVFKVGSSSDESEDDDELEAAAFFDSTLDFIVVIIFGYRSLRC